MQISGFSGQMQMPDIPLSDEQKTTMEEILSQYDAENMTKEDMESIRQELEDAGIPRSKESMQMMRAAGFGPPPKPQGAGMMMSQSSNSEKGELWNIYQQLQQGEISEEEFLAQIRTQAQAGSLISLIS